MTTIRYKSLPLWAIYAGGITFVVFFFWYLRSPKTEVPLQVHTGSKLSSKHFNVRKIPQMKDPAFDFNKAIETMNEERTAMDDAKLVDLIRNYLIQVPSEGDTYNLEDPTNLRFSAGQTSYVDQRLHGTEGVFYVETRAFAGESESTSLFFEKTRRWTGLLVEPDPVKFELLRNKNRKAYLLNACVTDKSYPTKRTLFRPDSTDLSKPGSESYTAQCFPLYSILLALEQNVITLLSLNFYELGSESQSEHDLLMSLPFEKLNVTFVGIRNLYSNKVHQAPLEWMMEQKGFELQGRLRTDDQWVNDLVFLNKINKLPTTPFWTSTNIFRAVVLFLVLYGIANVVAYKFLFPKLHLYKVAYGLV
ncbi:uncharacterized protein LOC110449592 [Mizuhopecten yessoensis]|nr:uncharacterized protein LOC110449592 [Mizuhopecten yessoensis]